MNVIEDGHNWYFFRFYLFPQCKQLSKNMIPLSADLSIYEGALVVTYEQLLKKAKEEQEDALQTKKNSNQLAIVLYTSGSTGVPKGNTTFCMLYICINYII